MKVSIIDKVRIKIKPMIDEERPLVGITYKTDNGLVRTVWIDEDKVSKDNVQKMILADLQNQGVSVDEVEWEWIVEI